MQQPLGYPVLRVQPLLVPGHQARFGDEHTGFLDNLHFVLDLAVGQNPENMNFHYTTLKTYTFSNEKKSMVSN
jgi:hypothetical protein